MVKNALDIKTKANIVQIISDFVKLEKKGANYMACCPFHQEKTPSFSVSPSKGIYKCFGCGEGGDAIKFLMDYKGLSYPEALEQAANYAGILVQYEKHTNREEILKVHREQRDKFKKIIEINSLAANEFHKNINDSIRSNFAGRSYQADTANNFLLGVAPSSGIIKKLGKTAKIDENDLIESGLLVKGEKGNYDFFRDRFIFPIKNHKGDILGFAGRSVPGTDQEPKYLNSKENQAYQKAQILYGLYENKKGIKESGLVYLVEGYTDVITMYEYGFKNAVATCGTSLSEYQAELLKHYTDRIICLFDGDDAGKKAFERNLITLVKAGFNISVLFLKNGLDPDNFLREFGQKALELEVEANEQDAIIAYVTQDFDSKKIHSRQSAINKAASLLSLIPDLTKRDLLIRELVKPNNLGNYKKLIEEAIKEYEEIHKSKTGKELSNQQREDIIRYGIFEKNNQYFATWDRDGDGGVSISNFIIKPIMLVIGARDSYRLVEIQNQFNQSYVLNLDAKNLTSLGKFRDEVERMGNFLFMGKDREYMKVKSKIYNCPSAYPITTMGYHKEGFYTWGNGISVNGSFKAVNQHGIVEYNEVLYFLPAFSMIKDQFKSDDFENDYEFETKFCFYPNQNPITFLEWTRLMVEVHAENGMMGVAWYCAALFRDIIFESFSCFPHLNLFGPPGSGKSFMAWSLMALFGKGEVFNPYHLPTGTIVGLNRQLAQVRNAIVWADEYSNDIDFSKVELLKTAYDGGGRVKGIASSDNRTVTTKVNSALMITGQQQPTQDAALFQRCISLNFDSVENRDNEKKKTADRLKEIESSGQLTCITQEIQKHRTIIQEKFYQEYDRLRSVFAATLKDDGFGSSDRILKNYLSPLAIVNLLSKCDGLHFGFDLWKFQESILQSMKNQMENMFAEDEVNIFWQIFSYSVSKGLFLHRIDYLIEERAEEKIMDPNTRDKKDSKEIRFNPTRKLLYVNFTKVHPEYLQVHQKTRGKNGLQLKALQHYLKNSNSFLGEKKSKWMGSTSKYVWVFDFEMTGVDIPDPNEVENIADQEETKEGQSKPF